MKTSRAASDKRFFLKNFGFDFEFFRDASGKVTHLVVCQGKEPMRAVRTE